MILRKSFIILGGLEIVLFALLGLIAAQSSFSSSSNTAVPTTVEAKPDDELIVAMPVTAILDNGICKITYLERAHGEYAPAALDLDSRASDYYPVLDGLKEGELVAVRGNFLLDSQFQISSPSSLFYITRPDTCRRT